MKYLIPALFLAFSGSVFSKNSGELLVCKFYTGGVIKIKIHDEYLNPFLGIPKITLNTESGDFQGYTYVSDESYTVAIPKNQKKNIKDVSHTISVDRSNGWFTFLEYGPDPGQPLHRKGICMNTQGKKL